MSSSHPERDPSAEPSPVATPIDRDTLEALRDGDPIDAPPDAEPPLRRTPRPAPAAAPAAPPQAAPQPIHVHVGGGKPGVFRSIVSSIITGWVIRIVWSVISFGLPAWIPFILAGILGLFGWVVKPPEGVRHVIDDVRLNTKKEWADLTDKLLSDKEKLDHAKDKVEAVVDKAKEKAHDVKKKAVDLKESVADNVQTAKTVASVASAFSSFKLPSISLPPPVKQITRTETEEEKIERLRAAIDERHSADVEQETQYFNAPRMVTRLVGTDEYGLAVHREVPNPNLTNPNNYRSWDHTGGSYWYHKRCRICDANYQARHQLDGIKSYHGENRGFTPELAPPAPGSEKIHTTKVTAFGETKTIAEWVKDPICNETNASLIMYRIKEGWPPRKALELISGSPEERQFEEAFRTQKQAELKADLERRRRLQD